MEAAEAAGGRPEVRQTVGSVLGFVSCALYLTSRLSQIHRNFHRQSAEGLASGMFACAAAANLFYGFALLLRSRSEEEVISSLPWLVGSLGTVGLDIVILAQSALYAKNDRKMAVSDAEEPLLEGGDLL